MDAKPELEGTVVLHLVDREAEESAGKIVEERELSMRFEHSLGRKART